MNIRHYFYRHSRPIIVFIVLGAINSLVSSLVLIFIGHAIRQQPLPYFPRFDWLMFLLIILTSVTLSYIYQANIIRFTNNNLYELETSILDKLRFADYESFEKLGSEKIYATLTDIKLLAGIPQNLITFVNSSIIIICALAYMFVLSPLSALLILSLVVGLTGFYILRNRLIEKDLNKLRDLQNTYYRHLRDLIMGFKEVKLSTVRNDNLTENFLKRTLKQSRGYDRKTAMRYMRNGLVGGYSWYMVLGIVLYVFPKFLHLNTASSLTFVFAILYIMGPVATIVGAIPFYTRMKIAFERINALERDINATSPHAGHRDMPDKGQNFESIFFNNVRYSYTSRNKEQSFTLGPLNLEIGKGEIVFIMGGNGSGKTTFVNLLTGLYRPAAGRIMMNGEVVSMRGYSFYCDQLSAIFTNNHLFSENYNDFEVDTEDPYLRKHIELFRLTSVLQMNKERGFFDNNLSKGQQKRLAMIYALMEDRPVIILDEWAAEQDPGFRAYFYRELIPWLKNQGKTVVAVTHDDAYYSYADRLIKFDFGKIVYDDVPRLERADLINYK
ncbi:cyclic peptide export ABC transporter [Flavitalea sp. BT771]|uniref:cyclic peptide export ABC transporter n=1 Tax=Flavitalea sp. BT771 TaxID=3063329 RepID=UPI0026E20AE3|nr:cyclic peptide export ABC transporter [Flavitalea sp. BT771]MDO6435730.1 cyclic peptide export ABC transporter [Flavitalea sp. BT771]MDV6224617.1 cyclic peptide export ABC transporter [Flavitalea sp. BT771]